jgi:hypothetical protein
VELRLYRSAVRQVAFKKVKTDSSGHFDFREVPPGSYRFLPSNTRGFKQPDHVFCDQHECKLKLVLQVNPTDGPYAGCPLK